MRLVPRLGRLILDVYSRLVPGNMRLGTAGEEGWAAMVLAGLIVPIGLALWATGYVIIR